jgi:hypothetical protein
MIDSSDNAIADLLLGYERKLMVSSIRGNRDVVSALLAEDFREFGSSGCSWSRAAMLDHLAAELPRPAPEVVDFHVTAIGPAAMLVTYRVIIGDAAGDGVNASSLRSSLWVLRNGRWQILFHQGTVIPPSAI